MPKHTKKSQSQKLAAGAKPYGMPKKNLPGKQSSAKPQQHARSIKAAAGALLSSFGQGGVMHLLEETGAELVEKGIRKKNGDHKKAATKQPEQEQQMQAVPCTAAQQPALFLPPAAPAAAATAQEVPKADINSLLSSWSLKQPAADAGDSKQATPAAAAEEQQQKQQWLSEISYNTLLHIPCQHSLKLSDPSRLISRDLLNRNSC